MDNKLAVCENKIYMMAVKVIMITVKVIGIILMAYLFFLSIFSTSVRSVRNYGTAENPQWGRYTYFLPDSWLKHVLIVMIVIGALWLVGRRKTSGRGQKGNRFAPEVICGIYFLAVLLYVLNTQLLPKSDPAGLLRIAEEILNQDFHEFEKEGYMYRYPYQSGFVFLCMGAVKLFGTKAYLALQAVNAAALAVFFYLLGKLAALLWGYHKKQVSFFLVICMAGSLPLLMYATFVYGNLPGMALSVAAVYCGELFLKERKKSSLICACVCIAMAIVLKSNCLIPFLAMLIIFIWDILKNKKKSSFLAVLCMLGCYVLVNQAAVFTMEGITGYKLSEGMPKTALIAMGLEESAAGPGTENGESNRIYEENNYDYKATDAAAKEKIFSRLGQYIKNPAAGISFFARKQALQCNEPTFQAFSISEGRESAITIPGWLACIILGRGSLYLAEIMNVVHTLILFGVCVYIFTFNIKDRNLNELVFLIIFIGAFLFQLFYEAKSQYMLIFFFMLLPYAFRGYQMSVSGLNKLRKRENQVKIIDFIKNNAVKIGVTAVVVCMAVAAGAATGLFAHTICLQSSGELLEEYEEVICTKENPNG